MQVATCIYELRIAEYDLGFPVWGSCVFRLPQPERFDTKNNMPKALADKYDKLKVHLNLSNSFALRFMILRLGVRV